MGRHVSPPPGLCRIVLFCGLVIINGVAVSIGSLLCGVYHRQYSTYLTCFAIWRGFHQSFQRRVDCFSARPAPSYNEYGRIYQRQKDPGFRDDYWRCIDDHHLEFFRQRVEQLGELGRGEDLDGIIRRRVSGWKEERSGGSVAMKNAIIETRLSPYNLTHARPIRNPENLVIPGLP